MSSTEIKRFQAVVWEYYRDHKRNMPWRETTDPYRIMVSEVMLQQTQVNRVIPKYQEFIEKFSTFEKLADSKFSKVLEAWQGLGYNRRAKYLHESAKQTVAKMWHTDFPRDHKLLKQLPGIGENTAKAIVVYAFNQPEVFIETNIRSVFLHQFFANETSVSDKDLLPLIEASLDQKNPREWYWALMDYGKYIKQTMVNPSRRSRHHATQSRFEGSRRQVRGDVLHLLGKQRMSLQALSAKVMDHRLESVLEDLISEQLVSKDEPSRYKIAD